MRSVPTLRLVSLLLAFVLVILGSAISPGRTQSGTASSAADVQKGHALAIKVCAVCHVAATDQPSEPLRHPPAPPFASIAKQRTFDAATLTQFITTTHRGLDNPNGMPNPDLMDEQVKEIVAYFLSLYPKP